jgi:hypothetical protein
MDTCGHADDDVALHTQDKAVLEAALQRAMTDDQRIAAAAAAAAGRATLQGQSTLLRASGVRSPDLRYVWRSLCYRVFVSLRASYTFTACRATQCDRIRSGHAL